MRTILQTLLPSYPGRLEVRRIASEITWNTKVFMTAFLNAEVLGVSVGLTSNGHVASVAFATTSDVILCTSDATEPGGRFIKSLLHSSVALAAFGMQRVALQIYMDLDHHIQGVDLSTLFAKSTIEPMLPSKVLREKLSAYRTQEVDELWEDKEEDSVCFRAFLSAWYVFSSSC